MGQYRYDFSVVMAVYNVEEYLREAVDSLVQQTIGFDRIQLILVDDGSNDGSGRAGRDFFPAGTDHDGRYPGDAFRC